MGGEATPRPFYLKSELSLHISRSIIRNVIKFVFIVCLPSLSGRIPKYAKTKMLSLVFTLHIAFEKNKKRFGTSLVASISASFLKENISHVIFY